MLKKLISVVVVSLLLFASPVFAQHGHQAGQSAQAAPVKMPSTEVFADGLQATLMVMKNEMHRNMLKDMKMKDDVEAGTTHDIMVLLADEETGKEFANVAVKIVVEDPDGNVQTKMGSYKAMMKTYDAYFKMAEKGKYTIKVLVEVQGKQRSIGISYDVT